MRNGLVAFLVLVTLPLLAALGHDAWLFYENQEKGFLLSEIGFLWTRYNPESFIAFRDIASPEDWALLNTYILDQKTALVTGLFAGFFYAIILLMKIFGIGTFKSESLIFTAKNRKVDEVLGQAKHKKFNYKRK